MSLRPVRSLGILHQVLFFLGMITIFRGNSSGIFSRIDSLIRLFNRFLSVAFLANLAEVIIVNCG